MMTTLRYFKVHKCLLRQLCPAILFRSKSTSGPSPRPDTIAENCDGVPDFVRPSEIFKRIDWNKILDEEERRKLERNLNRRDTKVDLKKILSLYELVTTQKTSTNTSDLVNELVKEALKIPNDTHISSLGCSDDEATVIRLHGRNDKSKVETEVPEFHQFCKTNKNLIRTDNLGNVSGTRSYFLLGPMAELEQALVRFAVNGVIQNGFEIISVPEIIYPHVIESCGFPTRGKRNQVYFLDASTPQQPNVEACLAGTAEMSIAGYFQNKIFTLEELPIKIAAVSRCYRSEVSEIKAEGGIYRVHYFTKVEMFGITANEVGSESNELQEEFRRIQENLFKLCEIPFRTLEMPPTELGLGAHRKFDVEAWLPGKKTYGEISSCSNCTDYQSRRLNMRYVTKDGQTKFVHTINGTACAVPRMLISLVENFQTPEGSVELPEAIQKFMKRSWKDSVANNPRVESNFLRTRTQMDRVTAEYL